jgi:hypothetical protein
MKNKYMYIVLLSMLILVFTSCSFINPEDNTDMFLEDDIQYMSKVDSQYFYIYSDSEWTREFVKGVNMGVGAPGYFPGEFGITKDDYLRWFEYIGDMNANAIRVYTILKPDFYNALYEYNQVADKPIYLFQGVWVNEEDIAEHLDAYDPQIIDRFKEDIQTTIDVLHGNKIIKKSRGYAYGIYDNDVSTYVMGYILGIEWDPVFVSETNEKHPERVDYNGVYLYSENASPFENFLCEMGDLCISYETENYKMQRPVSFTNWVTTDTLDHPNEPFFNEDMVSVDVEHIKNREHFKTGLFASYHVYPYYPDSMNYQIEYLDFRDEDGNPNTYRAYLRDLKKEHTMPVLVAEFGVPSSRGKAHDNIAMGFNQGNISEKDQGNMDASMLDDIYEEGFSGGLVFSFHDEWFKRTWNTMDFDLPDRRPFWNNYQTNEQHFGLLAFDSGTKKNPNYVDGDIKDWEGIDVLQEYENGELYIKSDNAYVYFLFKSSEYDFENDNLIIPIDTIPNQGNSSYEGVEFEKAADFIISIDVKDKSRILVDSYYDSFQYLYGERLKMIPENDNHYIKNSGSFEPMYLCLNREIYLPKDEVSLPFSKYETGRLLMGNADPKSEEYNSLTDFCIGDDVVEIRIPWQILNVMDPSTKMIMDDLHKAGIMPVEADVFSIGVGIMGSSDENQFIKMNTYDWDKWEMPVYHERLKPSYYILKDAFGKY